MLTDSSTATSALPAAVPGRVLRRLVAALVVLALGGAGAFVGIGTPRAVAATAEESELLALTNQSRAAAGLGALAYDAAASGVARGWADELARSRSLRHNPNLVAEVDSRVVTTWTRVGENVGYASTIAAVQGLYLASAPHRANILGQYNRVGVGVARDGTGQVWTTVVFILGPSLPSVSTASFSPFSSAADLVDQQYRDLLRRAPDPVGLATWSGALLGGQQTPASLVTAILTSAESTAMVAAVARLYRSYFLRLPDAGGFYHWVDYLQRGGSLAQASAAFAGSAEFAARYGALSTAAFVDLVYRNVLGRSPDLGGLTHWVGQLVTGIANRGTVMLGFSESSEHVWSTWGHTTVTLVYLGMLDRAPDPVGFATWTGRLAAGWSLESVVAAIWSSPEYQSRF